MNKPAFKRYETEQGVEYEILNSKGTAYYTVPLINGRAAGCKCEHIKYKPMCSHQDEAEKQEKIYQMERQPCKETVKDWRTDAPLNGGRGFSLLRR